MAQDEIFIVCGEPSGDLQAAALVRELLALNPQLRIFAVAGPALSKLAHIVFCDIKELSVFGFFDALKKLPRFIRLKKLILRKIKEEKPAAIILVDFSGFNLRLAKAINRSIPVIYYISPQVWASRQGRIKTIKEYITKMIVLFKFEEKFYAQRGIKVDYVGHPLLDIVKPTQDKQDFRAKFGLDASKVTIALLPGSRKQEIKNILPVMLKACSIIRAQKSNAQFLIAKSPQIDLEIYQKLTAPSRLDIKIIENQSYDCLNTADFCLVASGTATLETTIMQKPFVVIYKMGLLNYLLYRPMIKVPFIGMVNIVAGKKIIPEFIQFGARGEKIAETVLKILDDQDRLKQIKNDLALASSSLGEKGAAARAAKVISGL